MITEELVKEAQEQAKKFEESQTIGIYDSDEDYEYDRGWNKGEVAGFEEGYLASAEPREKRIAELEAQIERFKGDLELWESGACRATNLDKCGVVKELEAQIEKMKAELHHRLVNPSHDDSDCLDKIVGLDHLWQFGQEF